MPSGILATIDAEAGVDTLIYTEPTGKAKELTINICNKNDSDALIRLTAANANIEYNSILRANGVIERDGIALAGGQTLKGYSDSNNVNFTVWE